MVERDGAARVLGVAGLDLAVPAPTPELLAAPGCERAKSRASSPATPCVRVVTPIGVVTVIVFEAAPLVPVVASDEMEHSMR